MDPLRADRDLMHSRARCALGHGRRASPGCDTSSSLSFVAPAESLHLLVTGLLETQAARVCCQRKWRHGRHGPPTK